MSFTTPADGVPYTDAEPDDITAWLQGQASVAAVSAGRVIYTAGSWVPATTGTFPNNWAHGGLAFDKASPELAFMVLWCPASWSSPVVSLLCLAENFGTGNVRLRLGALDGDNDVTIAVASGVFHGAVTFPTPPSWSAGFGPSVGLQFAQFPLNRLGDDVLDTLDDDLAVLSVFVTET